MPESLRDVLDRAVPNTTALARPPTDDLWRRGRRAHATRVIATGAVAVFVVLGIAGVGALIAQRTDDGVRSVTVTDGVGRSSTTTQQRGAITRSLEGVTEVDIGGGFEATLTRSSSSPALRITTDPGQEDALAEVTVTITGARLRVERRNPPASEGPSPERPALRLSASVPDLHALNLSGGVAARIAGFDDRSVDRKVTLSGGVTLDGDLRGRTITLGATGGVTAKLGGQADRLEVDTSGGTVLDLSRLTVKTAKVTGSGGVLVDVAATERIDSCNASGGAEVRYPAPSKGVGPVVTSGGGRCGA
jgi:hypothetical protein